MGAGSPGRKDVGGLRAAVDPLRGLVRRGGGAGAAGGPADRRPISGRPRAPLATRHPCRSARQRCRRAGAGTRRDAARDAARLPRGDLGGPPDRPAGQSDPLGGGAPDPGRDRPPPRRRPAPPRRRAAARRDPLLELLRALRPEESLADARDHALLLVGWKAALRSDDLARLRMEDLHASEQGLSVFVARSKTDQTGHGTTLGIAAPESGVGEGNDESTLLDAGAAWVRWRDLLGSHGILEGPAWRGIDRYGRRPRAGGLHRNSIAEIIKRRAAAAGLEDAALWGGQPPPWVRHRSHRRRRPRTRRPTPRPLALPRRHGPLHRRRPHLRRHQPHPLAYLTSTTVATCRSS